MMMAATDSTSATAAAALKMISGPPAMPSTALAASTIRHASAVQKAHRRPCARPGMLARVAVPSTPDAMIAATGGWLRGLDQDRDHDQVFESEDRMACGQGGDGGLHRVLRSSS